MLVSHLHRDHFDDTAAELIADRLPVLCPPGDAVELRRRGLARVAEVDQAQRLGALEVVRTDGRHGVGALADELGPVSGFVLSDGSRTFYLAGDTIWCEEVRAAVERHRPDVAVVNAVGARFAGSERLVMDVDDVRDLCRAFPELLVVAVHLEAINHCPVTRDELRHASRGAHVVVPEDGEVVSVPPGGAVLAG